MNLPGLDDLVRQAQSFQEQIRRLREDLARETVTGSAGGGMVTAVANGQGRILQVKIERQVVRSDDVEMLEDLVVAAVNQAVSAARELALNRARALTGGVSIPGLEGLLS